MLPAFLRNLCVRHLYPVLLAPLFIDIVLKNNPQVVQERNGLKFCAKNVPLRITQGQLVIDLKVVVGTLKLRRIPAILVTTLSVRQHTCEHSMLNLERLIHIPSSDAHKVDERPNVGLATTERSIVKDDTMPCLRYVATPGYQR